MEILKPKGIKHLWIIVDEVETPGDLKRGLRDDTPSSIDDEYLLMVSEVIKHEKLAQPAPVCEFPCCSARWA